MYHNDNCRILDALLRCSCTKFTPSSIEYKVFISRCLNTVSRNKMGTLEQCRQREKFVALGSDETCTCLADARYQGVSPYRLRILFLFFVFSLSLSFVRKHTRACRPLIPVSISSNFFSPSVQSEPSGSIIAPSVVSSFFTLLVYHFARNSLLEVGSCLSTALRHFSRYSGYDCAQSFSWKPFRAFQARSTPEVTTSVNFQCWMTRPIFRRNLFL